RSAMSHGQLAEVQRIEAARGASLEAIEVLTGELIVIRRTIRADLDWQPVAELVKGTSYDVTARGSWTVNRDNPDARCGPGGYGDGKVPGRDGGKLMGRVGAGPEFAVGASSRLGPDAEGLLEMRAKDGGSRADNEGSLIVT